MAQYKDFPLGLVVGSREQGVGSSTVLGIQSRLEGSPHLPTLPTLPTLPIPDSRFPIPDSRF
ncbi:hypothetical protein BJP36_35520 [Moorena producens JHB]|uniref:Uncharacterized protein n=1 Tax=Moorena producens (strain JHB) TaxID=1454205 RepID=A0A9Q9STK9_MOOP1|nr:hypothetical protein [Moorena producens]WAN69402.1 hypothetical protein BJP36_35520 [Moorena producens JHB]